MAIEHDYRVSITPETVMDLLFGHPDGLSVREIRLHLHRSVIGPMTNIRAAARTREVLAALWIDGNVCPSSSKQKSWMLSDACRQRIDKDRAAKGPVDPVAVLRELEWSGVGYDEDENDKKACPWCGEFKPDDENPHRRSAHSATCKLAIAIYPNS